MKSIKSKIIVGLTISFIVFITIFFIIYLIFNGSNLGKSDWLAFLSGYLSFVGTIIVSIISLAQTAYYERKRKQKEKCDRTRNIRPIFSIEYSDFQEFTEDFILKIKNVGEYPVSNVIINYCYISQMLLPNEELILKCSYSDNSKYLMPESDFEKSEIGYPKKIVINYENIDGDDWYQGFEMKSFEGSYYYSLCKIERT